MTKNYKSLPFTMPENACNAHLHIIDPAFPNDGKAALQQGTLEQYRVVAETLGLKRAVFVQAKPFGCDNACLIDAIQKFGPSNCCGIAVVDSSVSDSELQYLHSNGIRGLRFSVWNPKNAVVSFQDCLPLSERIREMGWNVQLHMSSSQLLDYSDSIRQIKSKIVIDHMGRLNPSKGINDPAYRFIQEMIDRNNTWIKLSGPYLNTTEILPWEDASRTARNIAAFAPERVVWGSDWPHVTEKYKPDEFALTSMISDWLPSENARKLALVDNPQELYAF